VFGGKTIIPVLSVGEGVGVEVEVAVGVGVGDGVDVGLGNGVENFTPLSHTIFLPTLMHVYLTPLTTDVELILRQLAPALGAGEAILF
jgi:hypothetical protein